MSNAEILEKLFARDAIHLRRGSLFDRAPGSRASVAFDRLEGMMFGLAIGDSLGNTSESRLPEQRRARFGEIRHYLPNSYADRRAVGVPSDDTQMAAWTLEHLLDQGEYEPEALANRFCAEQIFGMGATVRQFRENCNGRGMAWHEAGPRSAGNGALMRIAPIVFPHIEEGTSDLWVDTALLAMTTHNDSVSTSSCLAFVAILWELLAMDEPPEPEWWLDQFVRVVEDLDPGTPYEPRGGRHTSYSGPFPAYLQTVVRDAWDRRLSTLAAATEWHSGAYLLETVPCVVYTLMKYGHDPEEALVRAVNDTRDNDTVGAIVGAAVGALHGKSGLPRRWVDDLLGRTREDDDGALNDLVARAKTRFWSGGA